MKPKLRTLLFFIVTNGLVFLGCSNPSVSAASGSPKATVSDLPPDSVGTEVTVDPLGEVPTMSDCRHYAILDRGPAGGFIIYDKGSYSAGWRYLEAAPSDQVRGMWADMADAMIQTGAVATDIGTGAANTAMIVAALGPGAAPYAAKNCADLVIGGLDDWFLPSKDELHLMFTSPLATVDPGFHETWYYWSSSEWDNVIDPRFAFVERTWIMVAMNKVSTL